MVYFYCAANTFNLFLSRLLWTGAHFFAAAKDWDFMTNGGDDGVFSSLNETVEEIGASGYQLLMTIGIIGLVFSIIFTAVTLLLTSNAQKKEEKKSHALTIAISGIIIFSVFSVIGFFQSIGDGI